MRARVGRLVVSTPDRRMLTDPPTQADPGPLSEEPAPGVEPSRADAAPPAVDAFDGFTRVDPLSVKAEKMVGLVICGVLSVVLPISLSLFTWLFDWSATLTGVTSVGGATLVALLLFYSLRWPPLEYRHLSYRVDEQRIEIRRGVIWRTVISVPRNRIQHTDVAQGPLQRHYGLATLVIHTAGTHNYEVTLEGLARPRALAVRESLLVDRSPDAV